MDCDHKSFQAVSFVICLWLLVDILSIFIYNLLFNSFKFYKNIINCKV